jgi:hypothetical protein
MILKKDSGALGAKGETMKKLNENVIHPKKQPRKSKLVLTDQELQPVKGGLGLGEEDPGRKQKNPG